MGNLEVDENFINEQVDVPIDTLVVNLTSEADDDGVLYDGVHM